MLRALQWPSVTSICRSTRQTLTKLWDATRELGRLAPLASEGIGPRAVRGDDRVGDDGRGEGTACGSENLRWLCEGDGV